MKRVQLNFQEMVAGVLAHVKAHRTAWQGIEPVEQSIAELEEAEAALDKAGRKQMQGTSAHTAEKDNRLATCFMLTQTMGQRVASFARRIGETTLEKQVLVRVYELEKTSEAEALRLCANVLDLARQHLDRLASYKVTQATIDELDSAITQVKGGKRNQQDQQTDITTQTARIEALESNARRILESLDMEIESMVDDDNFIEGYFIARRINDRRGRGVKPLAS